MMSLACTQMGLSAAEAWLAVTRHAAWSLDMPDTGTLTPGRAATWCCGMPRAIARSVSASATPDLRHLCERAT